MLIGIICANALFFLHCLYQFRDKYFSARHFIIANCCPCVVTDGEVRQRGRRVKRNSVQLNPLAHRRSFMATKKFENPMHDPIGLAAQQQLRDQRERKTKVVEMRRMRARSRADRSVRLRRLGTQRNLKQLSLDRIGDVWTQNRKRIQRLYH